jgi:hypothetical protein
MVHATAVDGLKRGRLRVGMVGGGRNAFIGAVHRMAMRLHDLIELKAGALSWDVENARASGADLGLAADRSYSHYREMAAREAARPDGIEAVVIVTPNHLHFPVANRGAAEVISARRAGRAPEKSATLTPSVLDGSRRVAFIEAAVQSSQNDGAWTFARFG